MNPKEQATQQSQNIFSSISNNLARYFSPSEEGKITLFKIPEQDFYKEPARLFNFLAESTIGSVLNLPRNLQVGSSLTGTGIGSKIVGRQGADEQFLTGAGMLGQGALDLLSLSPQGIVARGGRGAGAIKAAETLAPTAGKIIAKEAGVGALYGAGYGLSGGLQEAAKQPNENRLGTITSSTLLGGLLGGVLGGAIPTLSLAKRKFDESKFNQVKPKVESSLEKFSKEITSEKPKDIITPFKKETDLDTSINIPKKQKQDIRNTALKNTGLENIKSTDVNVNNKIDDVLTNLSQDNLDGAKQVLSNAPKDVRNKATKFFVTLAEKGKNIDNATRNNLLEIIDAGKNPTYVTRQSSELSKIAFKMTQDMDRNDVKNSLSYFSGLLRESKDEFRRIKLENPDSKITLETVVQRNLTNAVADLTNKYGISVADYLGSLIIRGGDEGFKGLSKSVAEVLSRYGTGTGQSTQSFANLVTPSRVVDEVNSILQQTFLKNSPEEVKDVTKTAQDLSEELQTINQDALGDKEVADKISEIGEKILKNITEKEKKEPEPSELIAKRVENTLLKEPKDDLEKKEQDLLKDIVEQAYKIIKEIKEKKILEDIEEVKPITFQDKMEKFREALKETNKYAKEWEQAKELLKDKYAGDEYKMSKLENFFERNIPSVLTDKQKLKITTQLLKEGKYRLNEIIKESGYTQYLNRESLREILVSTFYGVDEKILNPFVDEIFEIINKKTELVRKEAIERLLSTNKITTPKQKKDAAQKLFELSNTGVFDDAEIANKIFQIKGVPHLSEEMVDNIRMQLHLAQLPEGMERKISIEDAYRNIAKDIVENNKFSIKNSTDFITAYNAYFYTNIFSSFQTQERNILGGLVNALIFKPAVLIGEAIAARFTKGGNEKFSDVATYYKASLGNIGNAVDRFKAVWDKDYIAKSEDMSLEYFYREYRKKQLPKPLQVVGQFMEASDQFVSALIENGVSTVLQKRGFTPEQAQEQAFLASQQLLGKSYFKSTDIREVGVFDAFFNWIGKAGTEFKGKNNAWNLITTPIVPVLRLAINFQKLKLKLIPPAQLINMMTKKSRNVEDYAYLSIGTAVTAFAIDKYLNNEVTFEAPKDEAARRLFYDSGRKPFSVKIGNYWIPFQYMELFSAPLIFMGAVNSAYRENPDALTEADYMKASRAVGNFIKGFLVSPTYLANIAEMFAAIEETNGKNWGDVLAYPSTGFVPFVGLLRDIQDIIDPIRRKKESGWDEWKALYAKDQLKPYFNYEENPVKLSATELYAPYGIGTVNPKYEELYRNNIATKQFTKKFKKDIEEQNKAEEDTKRALFVAVNQADYNTARKIIVENKLTPQQVSSVTNKIKEREIFQGFTPEQRAIYNLTSNDAENLINRRPELQQEIQRIQSLKGIIQSPKESIFQQLKDLNKPMKIKSESTKRRARRIKKVRANVKKGLPKKPTTKKSTVKLKELKPIKLTQLKPIV